MLHSRRRYDWSVLIAATSNQLTPSSIDSSNIHWNRNTHWAAEIAQKWCFPRRLIVSEPEPRSLPCNDCKESVRVVWWHVFYTRICIICKRSEAIPLVLRSWLIRPRVREGSVSHVWKIVTGFAVMGIYVGILCLLFSDRHLESYVLPLKVDNSGDAENLSVVN